RGPARVNDLSFVSVVTPEGELGYECWIGGSLGKSTTMLAFKAIDFVPRAEVLAAGNALFNVHIEHSDFDQPGKGRLKFVIRRRGQEEVHRLFLEEFERTKLQEWPDPQPVTTPLSSSIAAVLARAPEGRSEEHTSELQSHLNLVCRLLLEKKKTEQRACHKRHKSITHR